MLSRCPIVMMSPFGGGGFAPRDLQNAEEIGNETKWEDGKSFCDFSIFLIYLQGEQNDLGKVVS